MSKINPVPRRKYRGRRKKLNVPLAVITALLALLLVLSIVFVYVLDGSIHATEDGLRFHVPGWSDDGDGKDIPPLVVE